MLENDYYIMEQLRKQKMKLGTQKKTGFYEAGRNKQANIPAQLAQNQVEDYDEYLRKNKVWEFTKTIFLLVGFFTLIVCLMYVL